MDDDSLMSLTDALADIEATAEGARKRLIREGWSEADAGQIATRLLDHLLSVAAASARAEVSAPPRTPSLPSQAFGFLLAVLALAAIPASVAVVIALFRWAFSV